MRSIQPKVRKKVGFCRLNKGGNQNELGRRALKKRPYHAEKGGGGGGGKCGKGIRRDRTFGQKNRLGNILGGKNAYGGSPISEGAGK